MLNLGSQLLCLGLLTLPAQLQSLRLVWLHQGIGQAKVHLLYASPFLSVWSGRGQQTKSGLK